MSGDHAEISRRKLFTRAAGLGVLHGVSITLEYYYYYMHSSNMNTEYMAFTIGSNGETIVICQQTGRLPVLRITVSGAKYGMLVEGCQEGDDLITDPCTVCVESLSTTCVLLAQSCVRVVHPVVKIPTSASATGKRLLSSDGLERFGRDPTPTSSHRQICLGSRMLSTRRRAATSIEVKAGKKGSNSIDAGQVLKKKQLYPRHMLTVRLRHHRRRSLRLRCQILVCLLR
ncbi:hypothetical protein GQ600_6796 [Phytophthora cactorum]|nr:hypothetical protein GQ600_6796 [Phytophthora cactorum]